MTNLFDYHSAKRKVLPGEMAHEILHKSKKRRCFECMECHKIVEDLNLHLRRVHKKQPYRISMPEVAMQRKRQGKV